MTGSSRTSNVWDPVQQREAWRAEHAGPWNGGVLATAGNLVFQGTASGELVVPAGARPEEQLTREGAKLYARHCGNCHGDAAVSGGVVPDLRYSHALTSDEFWTAVVHDGVLAARGMVSFKAELSASHEQALRAYLIQRALESRLP